jgi:DNA-3-methyladenine glycosylase I
MKPSIAGKDGKMRCFWCHETEQYTHYHDNEWGYPVDEDRRLFEKLCLEGFQAGLSWLTILKKRENFRKAFDNFDFNKIAKYTEKDVERLVLDAGIVRHRGKIEAVINNAKCAQHLIQEEGSLAHFFWRFEPDEKNQPDPMSISSSGISKDISKLLKKKGWKFVGPTTVYSFMQAMGLINDHAKDCDFRVASSKARRRFKRPTA